MFYGPPKQSNSLHKRLKYRKDPPLAESWALRWSYQWFRRNVTELLNHCANAKAPALFIAGRFPFKQKDSKKAREKDDRYSICLRSGPFGFALQTVKSLAWKNMSPVFRKGCLCGAALCYQQAALSTLSPLVTEYWPETLRTSGHVQKWRCPKSVNLPLLSRFLVGKTHCTWSHSPVCWTPMSFTLIKCQKHQKQVLIGLLTIHVFISRCVLLAASPHSWPPEILDP